MCHPNKEFRDLLIHEGTSWRIELRSRQNYLGWCFIILQRHLTDLLQITQKEQDELFTLTRALHQAVTKSFSPTMFNYASYGNKNPHVHLQIVPRYDHPVKFQGLAFEDKNWGKNYSPYDHKFVIPNTVKLQIRDIIKSHLR